MSVTKAAIITALSSTIPPEIVTHLINEYQAIKQHFFLKQYRPTELTGARFGECVLRLLEFLSTNRYTNFGTPVNSDNIINNISRTISSQTLSIFIPRLLRVILDMRNRRDVAHVGGEVSPNYSDSLFIVHSADWILTELVRHLHNCSIDEAQQIVKNINEIRIPIITEVEGFVRIQNPKLDTKTKCLVILYYKKGQKVSDIDICTWLRYKNLSRLKTEILPNLDAESFIHYENGFCTILDLGISFVEKNIPLDILI